ncbi:phage major tail protein [Clostridium aceticum]|uniref:Phage major tail protein n=1 Tax=Clostridium aceticum TaxID=84022 RepID=A0A0G3WE38_9CLOT|nr:major tail protein [Clostridium aceticum]AKL96623.1 phage major tail protein [Clostridium aceticum]
MDNKYGEFVGVDNLHAAIVLEDSFENYLAETPEYLAPSAEIAGAPEINSTPTYYDNVPANTYIGEGVTTLTLTIAGIPAEKAAKYLGKKYDPISGRVYDDGQPNPPDVAISFRFNKGKSGYRYYQYLKGTFSGGTEEATTKTSNIDVKTYQMTFTAVTTTKQWQIDGEMKPLKRIFADTTDPAFNPAGWYLQVQTPDTTEAPNALELSNSNPADEETEVAIDISPALTFNNKISSYNITMINKATLDVVAVELSLNPTGKIITINPTSNLTADTEYVVIIANVKDVYGQSLSNIIIKFITAA